MSISSEAAFSQTGADLWPLLVEQAIRAPSPHNVQPWKVRVSSRSSATLYTDMNRALPAEDVTGSFLLSAMGLFVEALSIAAHGHGLDLSVSLCDSAANFALRFRTPGTELVPFAHLSLEVDARGADALPASLLELRSTGRAAYKPIPVSTHCELKLRSAAHEAGLRFELTSDPEIVARLLQLNTHALFEDLNTPQYHDEIAQWFRCTQTEETSTSDGLSYRCMNMRPWEMRIAKYYPGILRLPLLASAFGSRYTRQNRCGSIGLLRGPFLEQPDVAIDFGRGLLRFWLAITREGLSIHPLGNLVTNLAAARKVESLLGTSQIWLIFKIGYLEGTAPRSLRRSVGDVLLK